MALGPGPAGLKFWTPSGITADSPPDDINNLPAGIGNQFNPWGPRRPVADWVLASPSFLISPTDTDNLPAGGANWFNPWGRKRPVADWFKGSVPLVPVTFTADSGSYALTGSAAFQALGHAAGSGSYTITGSAAALALGHVAGAGSYTLTGASAALALRHVAGAGSYTITGTAAGLVMPFTLTAAAGNYALTGTSAAFVIPGVADYLPAGMTGGYVPWGRRFPINLRSFTGRPFGTASITFTLTAAGGSYAITMQGASGPIVHKGVYRIIDRPTRLAFTWITAFTENRETLVTVDFIRLGQRTEVVVTHEQLPESAMPSHHKGWTSGLEHLDEACQKGFI